MTARVLGSFRGEAGFIVAAAVLVAALVVEWLFFDVRPVTALRALGLARPSGGSIALALGVSALMLAFYPLYGLVTGSMPRLRADALALAPGIFAQAGTEETVFRGFLFRHLRE